MPETKTHSLHDLGDEELVLIRKAEEAIEFAYAPYSLFSVGAAILLDNGVIVTGTNQENAAYPSGMCAERVALYSSASQYPGVGIRRLVVAAKRKGINSFVPATCCGACRQVMLEFEHRQKIPFQVIMLFNEDQWISAPSAETLLPFSFSRSSFEKTEGPV